MNRIISNSVMDSFLDDIIKEQKMFDGVISEAHPIGPFDSGKGKTWHGISGGDKAAPLSPEEQSNFREIHALIDKIEDNLYNIKSVAASERHPKGDLQKMKFLNQALEHIVKVELGL